MKTQTIFLIAISILFLTTFLFEIIPIPVSTQSCMVEKGIDNCCTINSKGINTDCGIYWTSGLYQLGVKNYNGVLGMFSIFLIATGNIYLIKKCGWIN